jgi:hypothetical protein
MMHLWKLWVDDKCPCCQAPAERARHVNRCPSPLLQTTFASRLHLLRIQLTNIRTEPSILQSLMQGIRSPSNTFHLPYASPALNKAALKQDSTGCDATLEGRISGSWRHLQYSYQCGTGDRKTPLSWASGVVKALLELTDGMWSPHNGYLHDRDSQGLERLAAANLQQRLGELRQVTAPQLLVHSRYLVSPPQLACLDSLSVTAKEAWIS